MSDIRPLRGLRPKPELAPKVASLPYDVMNTEEAREMADGNPYSFLHVIRAEIDFDHDIDPHSDEVYRKGAENLRRMVEEGVLFQDEKPCFYVYQLVMGEHRQRGIVAGASVEEYEKGLIKKHEHTKPDKEDDRTRHINTLNAQTGPVMLAYKARSEIDEFVDSICESRKPEYDFVGPGGVEHTLWPVCDEGLVAKLRELFADVDALYITDGHHRSAAAARVARERRAANPNHTGDEPYNFFLSVIFPHDQLQILGYHRVVKDLNGLSPEEFMAKVAEKFDVEPTDSPEPDAPHRFGMFLDGRWYRLTAKPGTFPEDDPVRSLDVSVLQENLLAPILGITDPRTDKRIDFVGGIRGIGELERRCREDMRLAFALYPTTIEQLMTIADAGAIMPPKSTWFEPKLLSGLVVHTLREGD